MGWWFPPNPLPYSGDATCWEGDKIAGFSKDEVKRAKEIDLLTYLQKYEPNELIKSGPHEYRTVTHSSLVISNGKWRWCRGGFGGTTALQYLIRVEGYSFIQAMEILSGLPSPQHVKQVSSKKQSMDLPESNQDINIVTKYLTKRGISQVIIQYCADNGILYESAHHHNCVFVGRDHDGNAKFATMRGTKSNFRQDVSGSNKDFGFLIKAKDMGCPILSVTEAPIDTMSLASISYNRQPDNWQNCYRLALCGDSLNALHHFFYEHYWIDTLVVCTDNDEVGNRIAQSISQRFDVERIIRRLPPHGKDFNDYLQFINKRKEYER